MAKDTQFVEKVGSKIIVNEREEFYAALERAESLVKGESSRGKVLIYVSAIERALEEVLLSVLVPSSHKDDSLLHNTVSTFESQIDLAFRIGVISHNLQRDLHIMRELREDCYNRIENFSFEHGAIKSSVDMLERNVGPSAFSGLPVLRMDSEDKFSFLARIVLITIEQIKERAGRLAEARVEGLYKD